jgi:hypothetical protein
MVSFVSGCAPFFLLRALYCTVMVTVAVLLDARPSLARYVKVSAPVNAAFGL